MYFYILFFLVCSMFSSMAHYEDTMFLSYFPSLNFNKDSFKKFLNDFNDSRYAEVFLPFSFEHLTQFINYAHKTKQENLFIESAFRLFLNKVKACPYISCYAFKDFLQHLVSAFKYSNLEHNLTLAPQTLKSALYDSVIDHFELLKQQNDLFFDNVTHDVLSSINHPHFKQEYLNNQQLYFIMLRFLECSLSKIVWPEQEGIKTWHITKDIAQLLSDWMNAGFINKDELDDLYKSLIESYCLFLKNYGHTLSTDTLKAIEQEITHNTTMLVILEEQEQSLQSKKSRLLDALMVARAHKQAQEKGILLNKAI